MLPAKFVSAGKSYVEADQHTAEKKRQHARKQYSEMTEVQRGNFLPRNRENKKGRFTDEQLSPASALNMSSAASMSPSPSTPTMQPRPSKKLPSRYTLDSYSHSIYIVLKKGPRHL
jgi:hypothetical protein